MYTKPGTLNHPDGDVLYEKEYTDLMQNPDTPRERRWGWTVRRVDMKVYVKGRIVHSDHATVILDDWHEVHMNTEGESGWADSGKMIFLD